MTEHLQILLKGVPSWNNWRTKHPEVDVDLSGAELAGANLGMVQLQGAKLFRADLRGANLASADLRRTNLCEARLNSAVLSGADLTDCDLSGADLSEVQIHDGLASAANLSRANLRGTRFTREGEGDAWNGFLELSTAQGLETASFERDSVLGRYVENAFVYVHDPEIPEARRYPNFIREVVERIRALRPLMSDEEEPPGELVQAVQAISDELVQHIRRHPDALYSLRPRLFEELIAEILASYGWAVQLTPPTRDGGYDIFAVSKDVSGLPSSWIIECRRHAQRNLVGVDLVRSLYAIKNDLRVGNALLATTSHFTRGVQAFKASKYDLALKDFEGIVEWINEYRPHPDGKLHLKEHRLILPGAKDWRTAEKAD